MRRLRLPRPISPPCGRMLSPYTVNNNERARIDASCVDAV